MNTVRRRVLRPAQGLPGPSAQQQLQIDKRRAKLQRERESLDRWMKRLKRAFNAVEKQRVRVARIEKQLAALQHG